MSQVVKKASTREFSKGTVFQLATGYKYSEKN